MLLGQIWVLVSLTIAWQSHNLHALWSTAFIRCEMFCRKRNLSSNAQFIRGSGESETILQWRRQFCISPDALAAANSDESLRVRKESQAIQLALTCICILLYRSVRERGESLLSLSLQPLINDVIESQWERTVELVSIQAPPPVALCMVAHMVLQHHIFTMHYYAAENGRERGRDTGMWLLAMCSDVNLPCLLRNELFILLNMQRATR